MAWFKVDDNFYDHPKVDELSLEAVGLWTLCGTYCARQLTDGRIPARRVYKLGGSEGVIGELIDAELWDQDGDDYQFRNWAEYQPTRDDIEEKRENARIRQRRKRERDADGRYVTNEEVTPNVTPHVTRDSRERHGVSHATPDPTRPDPVFSYENTPSSHVASDDDGKSNEVTDEIFFSEEVTELCDHLATLIRNNGNKVGKVGVTWWRAMDRLIRIDDYTPDQVRQVIDWSQQDEFWQGNIRSAPKLREKFDALKTRMLNERSKQARPVTYMNNTERKLAVGAERAQRFAQHSSQPQAGQRNSILNIIQGEIES